MGETGPRRAIYIPSPLWEDIQKAAADEGSRIGRPMSASEWIRDAVVARLATTTFRGVER